MGNITKSSQNNIVSPSGNSLAIFVDGVTGIIKIKDVLGNIQNLSDYIGTTRVNIIGALPSVNYGLFSQTQDSVPVTGTTEELSLINGGVGTLTVPANGFSVGDSFQALLVGTISCVGSATLDLKIKTESGVLLADTQVVNMDTSTNKSWRLDISFTIREIGVAGVASVTSGGLFSYTKNAGLNFEGSNFSIVNNTTFDTTVENKLVVTAQWNTNNAGNSIYSKTFVFKQSILKIKKMNKLEIVSGSLKITKDGIVLLLIPKDACAIDTLALDNSTPYVSIFNKYLANFTQVFKQPLSACVDSTDTPFTESSIIAFAEANLGF